MLETVGIARAAQLAPRGTSLLDTSRLTRQAKQQILDAILMRSEAVEGSTDLMSFLGRVWPLEQMPSEDYRFKTASGDIHKHMVMNHDWTTEELYTRRLALLDFMTGSEEKS